MKGKLGAVRSLTSGIVLGATLLSTPAPGDQTTAIPRIDVLIPQGRAAREQEGLRDGLRELGYNEGRSIVIEWRRHGETERDLAEVANALAQSKAGVIVVFGTPAARTALSATNKPVVFVAGDPVGTGLAASLAHPGGNATGVSMLTAELVGKRLELLHQLVPRMRRVALLRNPDNPLEVPVLRKVQQAAREIGLQLVTLEARNAKELDGTLRALKRSVADGMLVSSDSLFRANQARIAEATRKVGLPAIFPFYLARDDGALMSYGPSIGKATQRMAVYVDKILKGAKPSELPIEQMSTYELIIDLRVAHEMHIRVPEDVLLRADEVIR
ncbi:MAG: ABC transporter substrate-binding protein [Burkholderiales bacterium]